MSLGFRPATSKDLPALVAMLADDPLGATRERNVDPLPPSYHDAFAAIDADPNQELIVVDRDGVAIGVAQLTFTPSLTYQGSWRASIEGVRIHADHRAGGLGRKLFEYLIERARARGCLLVQLTTDKKRPDALRFYQSLGFVATHEGMKLRLDRRN